jgi:hypothetical protein
MLIILLPPLIWMSMWLQKEGGVKHATGIDFLAGGYGGCTDVYRGIHVDPRALFGGQAKGDKSKVFFIEQGWESAGVFTEVGAELLQLI